MEYWEKFPDSLVNLKMKNYNYEKKTQFPFFFYPDLFPDFSSIFFFTRGANKYVRRCESHFCCWVPDEVLEQLWLVLFCGDKNAFLGELVICRTFYYTKTRFCVKTWTFLIVLICFET